ncbi:MAG: hypothetical protein DHS20C17_04570 [Cyclobacteriaceae bacterium]|nr:MAG: hypothetical protein DHS20C17_04570 [Cyclobacteriaceae bacterium]
MRLGQLARKYGVSKNEIISFLKEIDPNTHSLGQNSKLSEETLTMVAQHFENLDLFGEAGEGQEQFQQEQEDGQADTPTEDDTITQSESDIADPEPASESSPDQADVSKKKDEVVIETDKLLELLESDESPADLDKITLIKAPKKELAGLKVVGKIELAEPKRKSAEKTAQKKEADTGRNRGGRQHEPLSAEEREKRRLEAKKRKEDYEAREERRRKAREKKQKKALNKARYQQKLQRANVNPQKHKELTTSQPALNTEPQPAPPKTLLGRFWQWMTTY